MRVRTVVNWLGVVFVVAIGPVLVEIERGPARAGAETSFGRASDEDVAAARALVSVLEAKVRTTESNLSNAIIGQEYKGTCRVEGNKWFHNGRMPNGAGFDELWERVN